jgi:hypothetical protein
MTITPEQKRAADRSGREPIRVEDPETKTAYLIVREDAYLRMKGLLDLEQPDRSLYEYEDDPPNIALSAVRVR